MIRSFVLSMLSLTAMAAPALADDAAARQLFTEAQAKYADRANLSSIKDAIELLNKAEAAVTEDLALKYEILVLASRSYYWLGVHVDGVDAKLAEFQNGMNKAAAAKLTSKDWADAYFFYAVNLGVWAQTRGIVDSLGRKNELMANLRDSAKLKSKAGEAEGTIDGYGPYRALGRLYHKLPAAVGGSQPRAVENLRKAANGAPGNVLNVIYLCEALLDGNAAARAEAKLLLEDLVKKAPNDPSFDPNRLPETTEELERAKSLLKDLT